MMEFEERFVPCPYTNLGTILLALRDQSTDGEDWFSEVLKEEYAKAETDADMQSHLYQVVESAYRNLLVDHADQALIFVGESGAGKTFQALRALDYLCHRSRGCQTSHASMSSRFCPLPSQERDLDTSQGSFLRDDVTLEDRVPMAFKLLNLFSSAPTEMNPTASCTLDLWQARFHPCGFLWGCHVTSHLLHCSRTSTPPLGQGTFCPLYAVQAGVKGRSREMLYLPASTKSGFHYLDYLEVPESKAAADYQLLLEGFGELNQQDEAWEVVRLLAAILHLGEIEFERQPGGEGELAKVVIAGGVGAEGSQALLRAAKLLKVDPEALAAALVEVANGQQHTTSSGRTSRREANWARNMLADHLYWALHRQLVGRINVALGSSCSPCSSKCGQASLLVLDPPAFWHDAEAKRPSPSPRTTPKQQHNGGIPFGTPAPPTATPPRKVSSSEGGKGDLRKRSASGCGAETRRRFRLGELLDNLASARCARFLGKDLALLVEHGVEEGLVNTGNANVKTLDRASREVGLLICPDPVMLLQDPPRPKLETKFGPSLISLLNQECIARNTHDNRLFAEMVKNFGEHPAIRFGSSLSSLSSPGSTGGKFWFVVKHYECPVTYTVDGFVEMNRQRLPAPLAELIKTSWDPFVAGLILPGARPVNPEWNEFITVTDDHYANANNSRLDEISIPMDRPAESGLGLEPPATLGQHAMMARSLRSAQHRLLAHQACDMTEGVIRVVSRATRHQIVCVKPNTNGTHSFSEVYIHAQLQHLGLWQFLQWKAACGFNLDCFFLHGDFLSRYSCLCSEVPQETENPAQACQEMLATMTFLPDLSFAVGSSHVFMTVATMKALDVRRERMLREGVLGKLKEALERQDLSVLDDFLELAEELKVDPNQLGVFELADFRLHRDHAVQHIREATGHGDLEALLEAMHEAMTYGLSDEAIDTAKNEAHRLILQAEIQTRLNTWADQDFNEVVDLRVLLDAVTQELARAEREQIPKETLKKPRQFHRKLKHLVEQDLLKRMAEVASHVDLDPEEIQSLLSEAEEIGLESGVEIVNRLHEQLRELEGVSEVTPPPAPPFRRIVSSELSPVRTPQGLSDKEFSELLAQNQQKKESLSKKSSSSGFGFASRTLSSHAMVSSPGSVDGGSAASSSQQSGLGGSVVSGSKASSLLSSYKSFSFLTKRTTTSAAKRQSHEAFPVDPFPVDATMDGSLVPTPDQRDRVASLDIEDTNPKECLLALQVGTQVLKLAYSRFTAHKTSWNVLKLSVDHKSLKWKKGHRKHTLQLKDVTAITLGPMSRTVRREWDKAPSWARLRSIWNYFSLHTVSRTYDFGSQDSRTVILWVRTLEHLLPQLVGSDQCLALARAQQYYAATLQHAEKASCGFYENSTPGSPRTSPNSHGTKEEEDVNLCPILRCMKKPIYRTAADLGISLDEWNLLHYAVEFLEPTLDGKVSKIRLENGNFGYMNIVTEEVTAEHPRLKEYRKKVEEAKRIMVNTPSTSPLQDFKSLTVDDDLPQTRSRRSTSSRSSVARLFWACLEANVEGIRSYVGAGGSVNNHYSHDQNHEEWVELAASRPWSEPPDQISALHYSIHNSQKIKDGAESVVQELLNWGAEVNCVLDFCQIEHTPLHSAVANAKIPLLRLLLQHGADPNIRGSEGYCPVHILTANSIDEDRLSILKELLAAGANVDIPEPCMGNTVLHLFSRQGDYELTRELLDVGAVSHMRNWECRTALEEVMVEIQLLQQSLEEANPQLEQQHRQVVYNRIENLNKIASLLQHHKKCPKQSLDEVVSI